MIVRTKPADLPPFFAERPRGNPTRARTMQAVGSAKRRWNSIQYQRATTGLFRDAACCGNCQVGTSEIAVGGWSLAVLASGKEIGRSVSWNVEIWYWSGLVGSCSWDEPFTR